MGSDFFDVWSLSHFAGGVVYRLVIFPDNWLLSFTLSVFLHLLGELVEQSVHPVTGDREDEINHQSDMLFFILGWLAGSFLQPYIAPYSSPLWKSPRMWLLGIAFVFTLKEFLREIIIIDGGGVTSKLLY